MSGTKAAVIISGVAAIAAMAIVGCLTGHDGPLLTAAIAAVSALVSGLGGYVKGVADERKAVNAVKASVLSTKSGGA